MTRQRGSIVLYLLFSLAAAIATGYGAYRVIRTQRLEREAAAAHAAATRPPRASVAPAQEPSSPTEVPPEVPPEVPIDEEMVVEPTDSAEARAVDPDAFADPAKDTVVYGTPGVTGGLTAASVERTVMRYSARIERCLRKAREQYRVRRGTVRAAVDVDAQGRVLSVTAKLDNAEEVLGDCVIDVFRRLRFDATSDGGRARIVYPIVFAPANGGDAGDPMPTPPATAGCDEVSCVLDNYAGACCEKFKRPDR